jgi:hypothetical protein
MNNSEKKVFSSDIFSEEVLQQAESLSDMVKRAHEEAIKRGIEANTIMIDNKLAYVKGFDFMETCRGGFHYVRQYPPMILGMDVFTCDLSREFPSGTGFVGTHRDTTTIDRIREEATDELIKELKEMPARDLLFKLYNDEIEDY